ncbi:putative membrane protein YadS [Escherichia coli]|uniref:Putative membrane protein YadS n=1 Tax=Escherichia coli TaxID=562 RepID=A0A377CXM3_ECOLX|nr:putative membrane protein YadS [Escherichia coli]
MLVYWLDIVGTAVFAISGVLLAGKLRMDPFGVLVLGVVTAVGGGTIRDNGAGSRPVFWVKDPRSGRCNGHQHADHRAGAPAKTLTKMDVAGAGRRWSGGVCRHWRE